MEGLSCVEALPVEFLSSLSRLVEGSRLTPSVDRCRGVDRSVTSVSSSVELSSCRAVELSSCRAVELSSC